MDAIPSRVLGQIQKICAKTGESVETIIERSVDLYEARHFRRPTKGKGSDRLAKLLKNPEKEEFFREMMQALSERSVGALTKEQRVERSASGGRARAASLSPEQRSAIAKKGAAQRWKKAKKNKSR